MLDINVNKAVVSVLSSVKVHHGHANRAAAFERADELVIFRSNHGHSQFSLDVHNSVARRLECA